MAVVTTSSVRDAISDRLEADRLLAGSGEVAVSRVCFSRIMVKADSVWVGGVTAWAQPIVPLSSSGLPGRSLPGGTIFCLIMFRPAGVWQVVRQMEPVRGPPSPRCTEGKGRMLWWSTTPH